MVVGGGGVDKRRERVFGTSLRSPSGHIMGFFSFLGFKSLSRGGKEVEFLEEA